MTVFKRFKQWIIFKYLPSYAQESAKEEMSRLKNRITELSAELVKERAYSAGLEYACRRSVTVNIEK